MNQTIIEYKNYQIEKVNEYGPHIGTSRSSFRLLLPFN